MNKTEEELIWESYDKNKGKPDKNTLSLIKKMYDNKNWPDISENDKNILYYGQMEEGWLILNLKKM